MTIESQQFLERDPLKTKRQEEIPSDVLAEILRKKLTIIPREKWGAVNPSPDAQFLKYQIDLREVMQYIVVHHSANKTPLGPLAIQETQLAKGYDDVAYNFIIGEDGTIYEGRPLFVMGAHAGVSVEEELLGAEIRSENELATRKGLDSRKSLDPAWRLDPDYGSIGICLDGNFQDKTPNEKQIAALKLLLSYLKTRFHIPKNNIIRHKDVDEQITRQRGLTPVKRACTCPGKIEKQEFTEGLTPDTERSKMKLNQ